MGFWAALLLVLIASPLALCQDDDITYDLHELEAYKTREELLQIIRDQSNSTRQDLDRFNASLAHVRKLTNFIQDWCASNSGVFTYANARRQACYGTRVYPLLADGFYNLSMMNVPTEFSFPLLRRRFVDDSRFALLAVARNLRREMSILKQYDGPASSGLQTLNNVRWNEAFVAGCRAVVANGMTEFLRKNHTKVQTGGKRNPFDRTFALAVRRKRQELVDGLKGDIMNVFSSGGAPTIGTLISILKKHNKGTKDAQRIREQLQEADVIGQQFNNCQMKRTCRSDALGRLRGAYVKLWIGAPDEFREQLLANLTARVSSCKFYCGPDVAALMSLSSLIIREEGSYMRVAQLLYASFCESDECLRVWRDTFYTPNNATTVWSFTVERAAKILPLGTRRYADSGVALGGIIVCCVLFAVLVGLAVVGIWWKTLLSRGVWLLLMIGLAGILASRLYVWGTLYAPLTFDVNATLGREGIIALCVGFFTRLIMVCVSFVLVHFFVQNKVLTIGLIVLGCVLTIGVIAITAYIFAKPGLQGEIALPLYLASASGAAMKVLLYVVVPTLVLSAFALLCSLILLVLFSYGWWTQRDEMSKSSTGPAFIRMYVLTVLLVLSFAAMTAISVAQLPSFDMESQLLFLVVGVITVESLVVLLLMMMIFNSWWTSRNIMTKKTSSENSSDSKPLLEEESNDEQTYPLRYAD